MEGKVSDGNKNLVYYIYTRVTIFVLMKNQNCEIQNVRKIFLWCIIKLVQKDFFQVSRVSGRGGSNFWNFPYIKRFFRQFKPIYLDRYLQVIGMAD